MGTYLQKAVTAKDTVQGTSKGKSFSILFIFLVSTFRFDYNENETSRPTSEDSFTNVSIRFVYKCIYVVMY